MNLLWRKPGSIIFVHSHHNVNINDQRAGGGKTLISKSGIFLAVRFLHRPTPFTCRYTFEHANIFELDSKPLRALPE